MRVTKLSSRSLKVCLMLSWLCRRLGWVSPLSDGGSPSGVAAWRFVTARAGCQTTISDFGIRILKHPQKWFHSSGFLHWGIEFFLLEGHFFFTKETNIRRKNAWLTQNNVVCCIAKYASNQVSFYSRYRDAVNRTSVSIEAFPAMPSPGSSPWYSVILVQCPAMCLVPDGGNMCPAVSLSWAGRVWTEKPRTVCCSVGTFSVQGVKPFYYKRSLKTLHLTYLGMLHMLYYMKENCKLLLLWHIMLE